MTFSVSLVFKMYDCLIFAGTIISIIEEQTFSHIYQFKFVIKCI